MIQPRRPTPRLFDPGSPADWALGAVTFLCLVALLTRAAGAW